MKRSDESGSYMEYRELTKVAILVGSLIVTVGAAYYFQFGPRLSSVQDHWGTFGDYFGGVLNPLFTFINFILLLISVTIQREELRVSRDELRKSASALEQQSVAMAIQNFEHTFFQLLSRANDIVKHMTYYSERVGRQAMQELLKEFHGLPDSSEYQQEGLKNDVKSMYAWFIDRWGNELSHYFRHQYHLFSFVDRSSLDQEQKQLYANIARAQLSDVEMTLLFYNCVLGDGSGGLKRLAESYGIFKHLDRSSILGSENLTGEGYISSSAFSD